MPPLAHYILNVVLCSGLLYGYYLIALRNKKFNQYNRFYLLFTVVLSIAIPLLKIQYWDETVERPDLVKLLVLVSDAAAPSAKAVYSNNDWLDGEWFATAIFICISIIILLALLYNVGKILNDIRNHPKKVWNNICFVFCNKKGTPYSFFRYIFWNDQIDINTSEGKHILQHELTHVQQNHTSDKVFLSLVLVVGWVNPFFWLVRKELHMIHEFIADQKAITDGDTEAFATMLLTASYPQRSFTITNSFFHSPIKRRLLMLTTSKLPTYSYLRRIMILPLLLFVTILFAFKAKEKITGRNYTQTYLHPTKAIDQKAELGFENNQPEHENLSSQSFQDTSLRKKKVVVKVLKQGEKITVTNSSGSVTETDPNPLFSTEDTSKNSKVLVVLDGVQMTWRELNDKNLQPNLIKQMNVLKGDAATSKYGEKGKYGVVEITTNSPDNSTTDNKSRDINSDDKKFERVFTKVEQPAKFPGGEEAWMRYLQRNLNSKVAAEKGMYTVKVQFIVSEQGLVSNVAAIEASKECSECVVQAINLIKKGPKWVPAVQNGRNVVYQMAKEISFNVD